MSIPVFDCHCDTIARCLWEGGNLRKNSFHLDLTRLKQYEKAVQVFAVCTETLDNPIGKASAMLELLNRQIKENSDIVKLCLNFHDINTAISENKIAALISVEGCEQIASLESAYNYGARILHITWNFDNELCGAVMGSGSGLTAKGREFVVKAQDMGFALDMSHISEKGFWDTLEVCKKPVIAGHSNSKALCGFPRNLTDGQFTALFKIGGGAGINFCPDFLDHGRNVDAAIAHIEHFMALGGEKAVFLGCDFDGIDDTPDGLSGVECLGNLYEGLLKRNYSEKLVKDIFWNNIYEIFGRML